MGQNGGSYLCKKPHFYLRKKAEEEVIFRMKRKHIFSSLLFMEVQQMGKGEKSCIHPLLTFLGRSVGAIKSPFAHKGKCLQIGHNESMTTETERNQAAEEEKKNGQNSFPLASKIEVDMDHISSQ